MVQTNPRLSLMQQFSQLLNFSFCEFTSSGQLITQLRAHYTGQAPLPMTA